MNEYTERREIRRKTPASPYLFARVARVLQFRGPRTGVGRRRTYVRRGSTEGEGLETVVLLPSASVRRGSAEGKVPKMRCYCRPQQGSVEEVGKIDRRDGFTGSRGQKLCECRTLLRVGVLELDSDAGFCAGLCNLASRYASDRFHWPFGRQVQLDQDPLAKAKWLVHLNECSAKRDIGADLIRKLIAGASVLRVG